MNHCTTLTPSRAAAIQILRLEGPGVDAFLERHFRGRRRPLAFGRLVDDGEELDEIVVHRHASGVDLHMHGGPALRDAMKRLCRDGGFAWGACEVDALFLSKDAGAIEAEAMEALTKARTKESLRFFAQQGEGPLSQTVTSLLTQIGDPEGLALLDVLLESSRRGLAFSTPPRVILHGAPNAGKSRLVNALLGRERMIVDDLAGTTRDLIEAEVAIDDFPFVLMDGAGLRESQDDIERRGMAKVRAAMAQSDIALNVVSVETMAKNQAVESSDAILVLSKVDLIDTQQRQQLQTQFEGAQLVSAQEGDGLKALRSAIVAKSAFRNKLDDSSVGTPFHPRQVDALTWARGVWETDAIVAREALFSVLGRSRMGADPEESA